MYHRPRSPKREYYPEYQADFRSWCVKDTEGNIWVSNVDQQTAERLAARYNGKTPPEKGRIPSA